MNKDIKILNNFINNKSVSVYRDNDNKIIVDGDIVIYNDEYHHIPVKIDILNGNIIWKGGMDGIKYGSLYSLLNFPDIVNGNVRISKNPYLTSLKYCPKYISGTLQCENCNISDISDIANYIGGYLILSYNPITDLSKLNDIYIGKNVELLHINSENIKNIHLKNDSSVIIYENVNNNIF
jgi:hypothetical protein